MPKMCNTLCEGCGVECRSAPITVKRLTPAQAQKLADLQKELGELVHLGAKIMRDHLVREGLVDQAIAEHYDLADDVFGTAPSRPGTHLYRIQEILLTAAKK